MAVKIDIIREMKVLKIQTSLNEQTQTLVLILTNKE
jgi:hypothetical protein